MRVKQRITAGDGNAVALAVILKHVEFVFNDFEWLMRILFILAVAAVAKKVTHSRGLEPGYGVVRKRPGQPIQFILIEILLSHIIHLCQ